jgi:GTP-binding protein Era
VKSGFVSITGRPNVGKSTLLNAILGEKIAITADKPQTTRNRIRGIYNGDDTQIVFLDTPGIHKPRTKLGSYMTETALAALADVDVILFLVDSALDAGPGDRRIVEQLRQTETPKILVISKIDCLSPEEVSRIAAEYRTLDLFADIVAVSARQRRGIEELLKAVRARLPEGPAYFPTDLVTDRPERFLAAEIIREKLLRYLEDEVPHGVAVEIESWQEEPDLIRIGAVIYCERASHKAIIIGRGGRKLKGIGKSARQDIERLTGTKVYLRMWVKVREHWRDSASMLSELGYRDKR